MFILAARNVETVLNCKEEPEDRCEATKVFKIAQGKIAGDGDDHFLRFVRIGPRRPEQWSLFLRWT